MISRRRFGGSALGMLGAGSGFASTVKGVRLGVTGYSFAGLTFPASIGAMRQIGIDACEVWFRHIEPKLPREELRAWRLGDSLPAFRQAGEQLRSAGIKIVALTFDMKDDFTGAELERVFQMAQALGAGRIATSTTFSVVERILPLMERFRMEAAFHGHKDAADPNQFAGPESFRRVLGMSRYAKINLDIGQFCAAGFDAVAFLKEQHRDIPAIHIRDGAPGRGTKLEWGTGTTPIGEVLSLLKKEQYAMAADIEYDYNGALGTVAEVKKCFDFCTRALD